MSEPVVAAIRYRSGQSPHDMLVAFVAALKARGVRVHGLLQDVVPEGGIDAVDIVTGGRIPIKAPNSYALRSKQCTLDISQLTAATMMLRRALDEQADIVVVERFGKAESAGEGLADDLLALMAAGIPTIVSVSEKEWAAWERFSGGLATELSGDLNALSAWWDRRV